jgi:glutathione S-transferase
MPAKNIKLVYFNARGRAELARLILAQAGADYEDKRVERSDWAAIKPSEIYYFSLV